LRRATVGDPQISFQLDAPVTCLAELIDADLTEQKTVVDDVDECSADVARCFMPATLVNSTATTVSE